MEATFDVPLQRLQDLWINAIDSGAISYWCSSVGGGDAGNHSPESFTLDEQRGAYVAPFRPGGYVLVTLHTPEDLGDDAPSAYVFDVLAVERALKVMAKRYPRHLADLIIGNDDATTADVFVQCALFGEAVYG